MCDKQKCASRTCSKDMAFPMQALLMCKDALFFSPLLAFRHDDFSELTLFESQREKCCSQILHKQKERSAWGQCLPTTTDSLLSYWDKPRFTFLLSHCLLSYFLSSHGGDLCKCLEKQMWLCGYSPFSKIHTSNRTH